MKKIIKFTRHVCNIFWPNRVPILDVSSSGAVPNTCLVQNVYQYFTKKVQLVQLRLTGQDSR